MKGKKTEEVKELTCGDIGASARWKSSKLGTPCTMPASMSSYLYPFAEPNYSKAISPRPGARTTRSPPAIPS